MPSQSNIPILDTVLRYLKGGITPIHTPGHKGGGFMPPELAEIVGKGTFALDVPAMEATDNTFHPHACIRAAHELAAELYGAAETRYLTAGSSLGIATMVMASLRPGDSLLLPRNVHQSVLSALVLSGAKPHWLMPSVTPRTGALGITGQQVRQALQADPSIRAVLLTRPTYYGVARRLDDVRAACDEFDCPLLIDEAHGAHLKFLPPGGPRQALDGGADLAVQSPHKTIATLVGSAQLHIGRGGRVPAERVQAMLNFLQTTSPSYLLLASLDACRAMLSREGERIFARAVERAEALRRRIEALGIETLRPDSVPELAHHALDPLRLVVHAAPLGVTGYEAQMHLRTRWRVEPELCDAFNVAFVLTPGDDDDVYNRLVDGLRELREVKTGAKHAFPPVVELPVPRAAMLPREAAFAPKVRVPLAEAAGRIVGETVTFYPPGIPVLVPGEILEPELIRLCQYLKAQGANTYASDTTLHGIVVVE